MALPNTTGTNGATQATSQTTVDAELADWIYHRAENDQGLGLDEIESSAHIYGLEDQTFQSRLNDVHYTVDPEGFIQAINISRTVRERSRQTCVYAKGDGNDVISTTTSGGSSVMRLQASCL